jgi:predicted transposase YbfD/YdcC
MGIFEDLQDKMKELEDKATHDGYWYCISDALLIMICGLLCRQQKIDDIHDWANSTPTRKFLLEHFGIERIFSRAQFYNLLALVDAEKFKLAFAEWMQYVLRGGLKGKTVSIDGKTVCGTDKLTKDGSVLHIASAIVSELKLVIGSQECYTKTGEINAFRELIALLDVTGAVVVADALHCKPKSAEAVVEAKADYLFVVKDNQESLKDDIELYIQNETVLSCQTIEKNGGRIETRTAYVTDDIDWLDQKEKWKNLSCIGAIHREFEKNGQKSSEWHYYISSATLTPETLLTHARLEWAVESMHWLLDVHFSEDKTRVWDMNVQKILNTARKIALNMIRIYKEALYSKNTPLTSVLKENLFDLERFAIFLHFFRAVPKLD